MASGGATGKLDLLAELFAEGVSIIGGELILGSLYLAHLRTDDQ